MNLELKITKYVDFKTDFTPEMKLIADHMEQSVIQNLLQGGRPAWVHTRMGAIARLHDYLRSSVGKKSDATSATVFAGEGLAGAFAHQFGADFTHPGSDKFQVFTGRDGNTVFTHGTKPHRIRIPARPYMMFQPEDEEFISQTILTKWVSQENGTPG